MSETSCQKCGDPKGSCATTPSSSVQNGKGDSPRNISGKFRQNFDGINWGSSSKSSKRKSR